MRNFLARPASYVAGSMLVPGDKSISHRSLMLSGLAEGTSEVTGFLASEDCLATLQAMRALGVRIEQRDRCPSCVGTDGAAGRSTRVGSGERAGGIGCRELNAVLEQ